jgi:hypothetical protein
MSLDALVGRSGRSRRTGDKSRPLNALAKRAQTAAVAVDVLENGTHEHLDELRGFPLRRDEAAAATRKAAANLQRIQQRAARVSGGRPAGWTAIAASSRRLSTAIAARFWSLAPESS